MTKTYIELQAEIQALEAAAAEAIEREKPVVADRIKEAIKIYGLTAEDLGLTKTAAPRTSTKRPKKQRQPKAVKGVVHLTLVKPPPSKNPAKYGDLAGNRWSGRGPTPQWLKDYEDRGHSREQFLIAS